MKTERNGRRIVPAAFLFHFAVMLFCAVFLEPMAINNDDAIIHGITSGAYGAESAVTVHTNVVLGGLLVLMQRLIPAVNWFVILEFLLLFLSFSLISSILMTKNQNALGVLLAAATALILAPGFYNELHNTKIAPLAAAAGMISVYAGLEQKRKLFLILGGGVALFASLIRLNAFFIGAALTAGLLFLPKAEEPGFSAFFRARRRYISGFGAVLALIAGFAAADVLIVRADPAGREYREYNRLRGAVSDFPLPGYEEREAEYRALGVSENDYRLIGEWNFADLELFDRATLAGIAAMREHPDAGAVLSDFFGVIADELDSRYFLFMLLPLAAGAVISKKGGRLPFLLTAAAYCVLLFCLCWIGRTPRWVTDGLSGAGVLAALAFIGPAGARRKPAAKTLLPAGMAAVALGAALMYGPEFGAYGAGFNREAGRIYQSLGERTEHLYLMDHLTSPAKEIGRIIPTFSALPDGLYSNIYELGGWDTGSTVKNGVLERYGAGLSPYRALLERENVFLADTKSYARKLTCLRENINAETEMSLYDVIDGYYIFAFARPLDYTETDGISVTETACSADERAGGFVYAGVRTAGAPPGVRAAYLELRDTALDTVRLYRGKITYANGLADVTLALPLEQLLRPSEVEVRAVFAAGDGVYASLPVPLAP